MLLLAQADWVPAGHGAAGAWLDLLGRWAPWVFLAALAVLVGRAWAQRGRYRTRALADAERERLRAAVAAAEERTVGEVLPVVLERSDRHPGAEWSAALAMILVGTGVLAVHLPWTHPAWVLGVQVALGACGFALARALPGFKRLFVSAARAREMAEEQAFQEFYRAGLHRTRASTGVLIFVSLLERRVVVLGDEGISAKVPPELWAEVDRAVLDGIRGGSLADGLVRAVQRCGDVLAEHFPRSADDTNEIPDRVIVRRE